MRTQTHCSPHAVRTALLLAALAPLAGCGTLSGYQANQTGKSYYKSGNYTAAAYEFRRATIDDPTNPDFVHNLAAARKKQGRVGEAEQVYRHALQIDPGHQPSYHGLARLLNEQGRQAEAVAMLQAWTDAQPYRAASHVELASMQRELGDVNGAESSLRNALRVRPNDPVALAHLGEIYHETGQSERAVAMYRRSLHAKWNQPQVHSRLASLTEPRLAMRPARSAPQMAAWQPFVPVPAGAVAMQPVPMHQPVANADPAHVPLIETADGTWIESPAVQPH